jgi:hypothetical protein
MFERIVDRLKIPKEFLDTYAPAVRAKFREASGKLAKESAREDGINQCLHVASSVVLRNPEHLDETLDRIRDEPALKGSDSNTILTIAALYYLLQSETHRLKAEEAEDRQGLRRVHQAFDQKEWLIGKDAMRTLGIEATSQ